MKYCIWAQATGEIVRWTSYPEDVPPGLVCEERAFDARDGYIQGGAFVTKPPRPSTDHVWDWTNKRWEDRRTTQQKWDAVRRKRDAIFATTVDRINALRWDDMTAKERIEWKEYRRALRDITLQPDPDNVTWPTPPSA